MVGFVVKEVGLVVLFLEVEIFYFGVGVVYGCEIVGGVFKVVVDEVYYVGMNDLVCIDEDDFVEREWEEDIEEEDFVVLDFVLFFFLLMELVRLFVGYYFVFEVVFFGEVGYCVFEGWGEELFDKLEFDGVFCVFYDGDYYDVEYVFV